MFVAPRLQIDTEPGCLDSATQPWNVVAPGLQIITDCGAHQNMSKTATRPCSLVNPYVRNSNKNVDLSSDPDMSRLGRPTSYSLLLHLLGLLTNSPSKC